MKFIKINNSYINVLKINTIEMRSYDNVELRISMDNEKLIFIDFETKEKANKYVEDLIKSLEEM